MTDGCAAVIVAEGSEINFACQEAGAELFPEYPHLCFNPCTSHGDLGHKVRDEYDKYKFWFRPFNETEDYFVFLEQSAEMMNHYTNAKSVALLIEDALWTEYFRKGLPGQFKPFKEMLADTGVEVVYYAETAIGEKMFLPVLDAIAKKNPDYIYNLNAYSDDVAFVKQWAEGAARNIDLYNNGGASTMPTYWGMTGGAAMGCVCSTYVGAALTERTIPFGEALIAKYGATPNWVS